MDTQPHRQTDVRATRLYNKKKKAIINQAKTVQKTREEPNNTAYTDENHITYVYIETDIYAIIYIPKSSHLITR